MEHLVYVQNPSQDHNGGDDDDDDPTALYIYYSFFILLLSLLFRICFYKKNYLNNMYPLFFVTLYTDILIVNSYDFLVFDNIIFHHYLEIV